MADKGAQQFVSSDNTHMNDYGHQDLASSLYNAIMNG